MFQLGGLPNFSAIFLKNNILSKLPSRLCFRLRNMLEDAQVYELVYVTCYILQTNY